MEQFGHFQIHEELGRGLLGPVFRAVDQRLNRECALKVLTVATGPKYLRRFKLEAQILAQLNRPEFLEIYEFGEVDGRAFIAMEWIHGQSMAAAPGDSPLPIIAVIRRLMLLANALHPIHAKGYVHRNLKPSNLFLVNDALKIADFGLARSEASDESLSLSLDQVENSVYTAPEILLNEDSIDTRADIYALCAIGFEWATGQPPFAGSSEREVKMNIVENKIAFNDKWMLLPPALKRLISKGLQLKPDGRYSDIVEFMTTIRDVEVELLHSQPKRTFSIWFVTCLLAFIVLGFSLHSWREAVSDKNSVRAELDKKIGQQSKLQTSLSAPILATNEIAVKKLQLELTQIKDLLSRPVGSLELVKKRLFALTIASIHLPGDSSSEMVKRKWELVLECTELVDRYFGNLADNVNRAYLDTINSPDFVEPKEPLLKVKANFRSLSVLDQLREFNGSKRDRGAFISALRNHIAALPSPQLQQFWNLHLSLFVSKPDSDYWQQFTSSSIGFMRFAVKTNDRTLRLDACESVYLLSTFLQQKYRNIAAELPNLQNYEKALRREYEKFGRPFKTNTLEHAFIYAPIANDSYEVFDQWSLIARAHPFDQTASNRQFLASQRRTCISAFKGIVLDVRSCYVGYAEFLRALRQQDSDQIYQYAVSLFLHSIVSDRELAVLVAANLANYQQKQPDDVTDGQRLIVDLMKRFLKCDSRPVSGSSDLKFTSREVQVEIEETQRFANYLNSFESEDLAVANLMNAMFALKAGLVVKLRDKITDSLDNLAVFCSRIESVFPPLERSVLLHKIYGDVLRQIVAQLFDDDKIDLHLKIQAICHKRIQLESDKFRQRFGDYVPGTNYAAEYLGKSERVRYLLLERKKAIEQAKQK